MHLDICMRKYEIINSTKQATVKSSYAHDFKTVASFYIFLVYYLKFVEIFKEW